MKVSLNLVKKFIDFDLPNNDELVDRIGIQLGAIEEGVFELGPVYEGVLIVDVKECDPIENSDHLNLCKVDDGGVTEGIDRDNHGLIQIVCGAPNIRVGIKTAWIPPGCIVPVTAFSDEPFELSSRELRGHISHGMLASPRELGVSDDHGGVLEIDDDVEAGYSFSKLYEFENEVIIDIENKMFTHRPDCFGIIGVAREIAGILDKPFISPNDYLLPDLDINVTTELSLDVVNQITDLVPRFSAIILKDIQIKLSNYKIQSYLSRLGVRPINNIVDATNMVMLVYGQPMHAYDYDKLVALSGERPNINIRKPSDDEKIKLLNGKTISPSKDAIVIASGDNAVGLGGVMGAANSEVDKDTKTIVLEAATFDMYSIRRSSMENGIFSDAVTRFNKGQSPLQNTSAMFECLKIISESNVINYASNLIDVNNLSDDIIARNSIHEKVIITAEYINERLGTDLSSKDIAIILTNTEFKVEIRDMLIEVSAPFWRTDIEIKEDVVEEVGRLYGYDRITPAYLNREVRAIEPNKNLNKNRQIRNILAEAGANELLNYSFISKNLISKAGQDSSVAYEIANSLSPELNFYRVSLTPSLLNKVHPNIKAGYDNFALFELGSYHLVDEFEDGTGPQPKEIYSLSLVYSSKNSKNGAAYFKAKNYLTFLSKRLGLSGLTFVLLSEFNDIDNKLKELVKPYDQNRSALIIDKSGSQIGVIGEIQNKVVTGLKLPYYTSAFEILTDYLPNNRVFDYVKPSKYPSLKQDLTLRINREVRYSDIDKALDEALSEIKETDSKYNLSLISIYEPKENNEVLHYSFRIVFTSYSHTLNDEIVNKIIDELVVKLNNSFAAERI